MFNLAKLYFPKFLSCVFLVGVGQKEVLLWDFEKGSKTATFLQFTYIVADLLSDLIGRSLQLGLEMTHLFLYPPLASLTPGPGGCIQLNLSHTPSSFCRVFIPKKKKLEATRPSHGFLSVHMGPQFILNYLYMYISSILSCLPIHCSHYPMGS